MATSYVLHNTLAIYKMYIQKGLSKSNISTTRPMCLVVVLQIASHEAILRITSTCIQRSSIYTVVVVATSV
jgi:hypothetical protein